MTAALLNFDKDNSIEIGGNFEATIQIFDAPNLLDFQGKCNIKSADVETVLLSPTITIINHDTFTFTINFRSF